ncbi:MAG: hypothetical protein H0V01_09715 [Bacteroidetes bacterium]|nr:hypothetical protein [Bacteroidota bacterium]HET6243123.1 hypothetical protein [Bacteroidia bacterium]
MNSNIANSNQSSSYQFLLLVILKITCFGVFIGRAWEHLRWDPPFRSFLWDQSLLEPFILKITGLSWMEYATSDKVDSLIQNTVFSIGLFYVLCAIAALVISKKHLLIYRLCKYILILGSLSLIFLAFLYYKERFMEVGQFFEYTSQFSSPLILLLLLSGFSKKGMVFFIKAAIALTFICHGLYAIGFYSIPGEWVDMLIVSLNVSEQSAYSILYLAGTLDIVFSVLIFIPGLVKPSLVYLLLWGLATTASRVYANIYIDSFWLIVEIYLHQVLYRVPHFLLPLSLLFIIKDRSILSELIKCISIDNKHSKSHEPEPQPQSS